MDRISGEERGVKHRPKRNEDMFAAYITLTVLAAGANSYAAALDFLRSQKILTTMQKLAVPESWLPIGIAVPLIGTAAAVGLILFLSEQSSPTSVRTMTPSAWQLCSSFSLLLHFCSGAMSEHRWH